MSDKSDAAMEGESGPQWPFVSHKREGKKGEMEYISLQVPAFYLSSHFMALGAPRRTKHRDNTDILSKLSYLNQKT